MQLKGQIGIQFMIAVAMSFLILTILLTSIANRYKNINDEDRRIRVKDIAIKLREEIVLSSSSHDNYFRSFYIPEELLGKSYNITSSGNFLTVAQGQEEHITITPEFTGSFNLGFNNITKNQGGICVNC